MKRTAQAAVGFLVLSAAAFGQRPPARPAFEVASIKVAPPLVPELAHAGKLHLGVTIDAARADFGGVSLTDLIARAYRVRTFQISGPDWMNGARFDIVAKLPEGASTEQVPEMLQTLLEDRFNLTMHRESQEFPVYALVIAKGGANLTARPANFDPAVQTNERSLGIEAYAELISNSVDRPVVDQTALKGEYVFARSFLMPSMIDQMRAVARQAGVATSAPSGAAMGSGPAEASSDSQVPPTFGAVETLGLKLEPRKLPLPRLMIDHLEKSPTGN